MNKCYLIGAECFRASVWLSVSFVFLIVLGTYSDACASPFQSDSNKIVNKVSVPKSGETISPDIIRDWKEKLIDLREHHKTDPALAFQFIATVTAQHMYDEYPAASSLYMYTVKTAKWSDGPEAIKAEAERIMPLLQPKQQEKWKKEIKEKDPALLHQIADFWERRDPLLSTPQNERLLEHWQRIAYARKHFTKAHNTVYHTDDRGLIYVKYGKPQQMVHQTILPPNEITNPLTGGPTLVNGYVLRPKIPLIMEFELWVYQFSNRGEPSYYLFGQDAHGGGFGLQPGILHMIPTYGYSDPMAGLTRMGGALMIKYAMIQKMIGTTGYFNQIFNDLTSDLISNSMGREGASVFQAPSILMRYENKEIQDAQTRDRESPPSVTGMVTGNTMLPIWKKVYRFESAEGKDEYMLALVPDIPKFKSEIKIRDKKRVVQTLLKVQSSLVSFTKQGVGEREDSLSYFLNSMDERVPFIYDFVPDSSEDSLLAGIDIVDYKNNHQDVMDTDGKFSSLIGSTGPIKINLPQPLPRDSSEMSDIVMKGVNTIDWGKVLGHNSNIETGRLPFVPSIYPIYDLNSQAEVYFEVYDLPSDHYEVEYSFDRYPAPPDKFTKPYHYKRKAAVTVNYNNRQATDKHVLLVDLSNLPIGWYDLVLTLKTDSTVRKPVVRRARFVITDLNKQ